MTDRPRLPPEAYVCRPDAERPMTTFTAGQSVPLLPEAKPNAPFAAVVTAVDYAAREVTFTAPNLPRAAYVFRAPDYGAAYEVGALCAGYERDGSTVFEPIAADTPPGLPDTAAYVTMVDRVTGDVALGLIDEALADLARLVRDRFWAP